MEETVVLDAGSPTERSINCDGKTIKININNSKIESVPIGVEESQLELEDPIFQNSSQNNNEKGGVVDDLKIDSKESKTCSFFATQRGCKYGDNCPFKHYRSVNDAGDYSSDGGNHHGSNFANSNKQPNLQQTGMSSGEDKQFPDGKSEKGKRSRKFTDNICRFSKQEKSCPRKTCRFYHPENKHRTPDPSDPSERSVESFNDTPELVQKTVNLQDTKELKSNINRDQVEVKDDDNKTNFTPVKHNESEVNEKNGEIEKMSKENKSKPNVGKDCLKENTKKRSERPCKFYLSSKGCKFKNCSYLHQNNNNQLSSSNEEEKENYVNAAKDEEAVKIIVQNDETNLISRENQNLEQNIESEKNYKKQVCKYYNTTKRCFKGNSCPYQHTKILKNIQNVKNDSSTLRNTEFKQLETHFKAGNKFTLVNEDPKRIYCVVISPTDPDWSFIVKEFTIRVEFPESYPEEIFHVELVKEENYPEGFTESFNEKLSEWTEERKLSRKTHDLDFRPFLRWFDRNLSDIFRKAATMVKLIMDAKASGIQLIYHQDILAGKLNNENTDAAEVVEDTSHEETRESLEPLDDVLPTEEANELFDQTDSNASKQGGQLSEKVKKGTEVKFTNLSLNENIGTIQLKSAKLTLECGRCRARSDVQLAEKRTTESVCGKCNATQTVSFHPELVHQHSAVVGYLHMEGCTAFDLILNDSVVILNCLNCSKDNILKGMSYGAKEHWCRSCHMKMDLTIQATKFHQIKIQGDRSGNSKNISTKSSAKKKAGGEPGVKEGTPLADQGTCKHYKKSFRWLRFPCCGKIYPCDICHEEKKDDGHEMKFATRMICGHCSKEQPFSKEKPCVGCQGNLTKGKSAHWEGGKGCRDRSKMSKNDRQKTAGLGKTVSRKKNGDSDKKKT